MFDITWHMCSDNTSLEVPNTRIVHQICTNILNDFVVLALKEILKYYLAVLVEKLLYSSSKHPQKTATYEVLEPPSVYLCTN